MEVKFVKAFLQWSQSPVLYSSSPPQTMVSKLSSPSLQRRTLSDGVLVFGYIPRLDRTLLCGANLYRSKFTDYPKLRAKTITRACSDALGAFFDEEYSKQIQELAMTFQLSDDDVEENRNPTTAESESVNDSVEINDVNGKIIFIQRPFEPINIFSVYGKTTSVGENKGGGGKFHRIDSGSDGDGRFNMNYGLTSRGSPMTKREEESVSGQAVREEEVRICSIVEEATRKQAEVREEALDDETLQMFVSPVTPKIDADDDIDSAGDYFRTELVYQTGLAEDPNNCLLLVNYAQFLYLFSHDHARAEEYFKRAIKLEPQDAEVLSKYAGFLWHAKKDLWAAEEMYLEAISAEPMNAYYAANYAHFLWSTGGEDTCFPIHPNDV